MKSPWVHNRLSRRAVLRHLLAAAPAALLLAPWRSTTAKVAERSVSFRHTHTGESLSVTYWADGTYVPDALRRVDHLLRDFRSDEVHAIDPQLLDILHEVATKMGNGGVFEVISAYRSPSTNSMLRGKSTGVAKNSLHIQGRAIDVRLTGVDTARLRDVALDLKRGGVGYYGSSDFVHLDTGRFRTW